MTLTSTTTKIQYNGDGSTVSFPITFVFWLNADIKVIHKNAAGTETTWALGTQYTLTGGEGSTGTLTVEVSPTDYTPASGETLTIKSIVPSTQTTSLPLGGALQSVAIEERFDKNVRLVQQREEELDRSIKLSETSTASEVILADPVTGEFLRWKADGSLESAPLSASGTATGVDETDTDATKDKLTSNALAKRAEDTAQAVNGVQVASAVNQLQVTNSATGNPVLIAPTGTDTNISVNLTPKGTGTFTLPILDVDNININGNTISSSNTNGDIDIAPDGTGGLLVGGAKLFTNMIDGLELANGTDATNDINIGTGVCIDSTNKIVMERTAVITKQIDANWAVGNNAGGFPSGLTLTNDTWYHVFLIKRTDTGVVDAGFDTSLTATNLLSDATNYDAYRRIGSVRRATALNKLFKQSGDEILWETPIFEYAATPANSRALLTITVPTGVKVKALGSIQMDGPGLQIRHWRVYDPDLPDIATADSNFTGRLSPSNQESNAFSTYSILTNTSAQLAHRGLAASTCRLNCRGYIDFRGKI